MVYSCIISLPGRTIASTNELKRGNYPLNFQNHVKSEPQAKQSRSANLRSLRIASLQTLAMTENHKGSQTYSSLFFESL